MVDPSTFSSPNGIGEFAGAGRWLDLELVPQALGKVLVERQGRRTVVVFDQGVHELADQPFVETALVDGSANLLGRGRKIRLMLHRLRDPDQLARLPANFASAPVQPTGEVWTRPLAVQSGPQRAAGQGQRFLPSRRGDRLLESSQIGGEDFGIDPDLFRSARHDRVLAEMAPQVIDRLTECGASFGLSKVRPEQRDDGVPAMKPGGAFSGEINQQCQPLLLRQLVEVVPSVAVGQFDPAKKIQAIHEHRPVRPRVLLGAALILSLLSACASSAPPARPGEGRYVAVDLADLLPCMESAATAISDDRTIVGWCVQEGRTEAFAYRMADGMRVLPGLPGSLVDRAHAVNLGDIVVGESDSRAVRWLPGHRAEMIPGFPSGTRSVALTIDERGRITGVARFPSGREPFEWDPPDEARIGAGLIGLGTERTPPGHLQYGTFEAEVRDANHSGTMLIALEGLGHAPAGALIRADGRIWRLDPAGVGIGVEPLDLSDTCEWVVGYTLTASGHRRATWWHRDC